MGRTPPESVTLSTTACLGKFGIAPSFGTFTMMASLNNLVIGLCRYAGFTNLARARRVCDSLFNQTTYLAIGRMLT